MTPLHPLFWLVPHCVTGSPFGPGYHHSETGINMLQSTSVAPQITHLLSAHPWLDERWEESKRNDSVALAYSCHRPEWGVKDCFPFLSILSKLSSPQTHYLLSQRPSLTEWTMAVTMSFVPWKLTSMNVLRDRSVLRDGMLRWMLTKMID